MEQKKLLALLHDLRNYVGAQKTFRMDVLVDEIVSPDCFEFLDTALITGNRLIEEFETEILSPSTGDSCITTMSEAEAVIRRVVEDVKRTYGFKDVEVISKLTTDEQYYDSGDHGETVVRELARNAARSGATKFILEAESISGGLKIEVKDNGLGMPPDKVNVLNTRTDICTSKGGTSIIKQRIREIGGSVYWTSIHRIGTCCTMTLRRKES